MTNEIWQIVRLPTKDFLRLWRGLSLNRKFPVLAGKRNNSLESGNDSKELLLVGELSEDQQGCRNQKEVPRGFLAVYVGPEMKRFVIPASYLSFPDFRVLMERVAEEFGFEQEGGLRIPCEEDDFEDILLRCFTKHQRMMRKKKKENERS